MAIRSGDWKLVRYDSMAEKNGVKGVSATKLYNLANDIHEDHDRAAELPEKVKELQAKWDDWNKQNIASGGKDDGGDNDGPEPGAPRGKKKGER